MTSRREQLSKAADVALPTVRLAGRVARLEESVRENALLAAPLEAQVADLEERLVPVLEAAERRAGRA